MLIVLCKFSERRKKALTQRCNKLWWRNEKMNMSFWVTWQLPDRVNNCRFEFPQLPDRVNHCKFKFRQLPDRVNNYRFEFPTDNWATSCTTSGWMKHTNLSRRKASWAAFWKAASWAILKVNKSFLCLAPEAWALFKI